MTGFFRIRAAAAAVILLCSVEAVAAGPTVLPASPQASAPKSLDIQYYGYGYPPYRRPYGYYRPHGYYRPYGGYGPGPRYYANHFGPGAAKQRYRTRETYCINKPERC